MNGVKKNYFLHRKLRERDVRVREQRMRTNRKGRKEGERDRDKIIENELLKYIMVSVKGEEGGQGGGRDLLKGKMKTSDPKK